MVPLLAWLIVPSTAMPRGNCDGIPRVGSMAGLTAHHHQHHHHVHGDSRAGSRSHGTEHHRTGSCCRAAAPVAVLERATPNILDPSAGIPSLTHVHFLSRSDLDAAASIDRQALRQPPRSPPILDRGLFLVHLSFLI